MAQFSPTEVQSLSKEAVPFSQDKVGGESKVTGLQAQAAVSSAEADRMQGLGFFGQLKEGIGIATERARVAQEARRPSFFENKNVPNKPEEPTNINASTPHII